MSSLDNVDKEVGFVGLGAMGLAIAEQLVDHFPLVVTDLNRERASGLENRGAAFATTDKFGETCDVVITCLPRPADVERALFGPTGIAKNMRPGSTVVDMTTGSPTADRDIAQQLAEMDIDFSDAPVSGGPHGARAGTLTIMVGASPDCFSEIEPVLRTVSPIVLWVGDLGAGHGMKLAANLLSACHRLATVEAMKLAMTCGVRFDDALAALNQTGGRSYISDTIYPKFVQADGYTPQNFSVGLLRKDVCLAQDLEFALDLDMWATGPVVRFLNEAVDRYGETSDINRVMAHWFDETHETP
jgi:3-hydroxyisobutyrate dehydrogenase-like beta-hydroxyacid dehydrogenase